MEQQNNRTTDRPRYLLMMRDEAAHSLSDRRLSLQSFQIVLYPEEVGTEHDR